MKDGVARAGEKNTSGVAPCARRREMLEDLYQCSDNLHALSGIIRCAVIEGKLDSLPMLRDKVESLHNAIIGGLRTLIDHHREHNC